MIDQLAVLISAKSGEKPILAPRPEFALDRVKRRRFDTKRDTALPQLLGGRY